MSPMGKQLGETVSFKGFDIQQGEIIGQKKKLKRSFTISRTGDKNEQRETDNDLKGK